MQTPVPEFSVKDKAGVHEVQKNEVTEQVAHGSLHYWHWLKESTKYPVPPEHVEQGGRHRSIHWFPFKL
jgi:hypothetical protein